MMSRATLRATDVFAVEDAFANPVGGPGRIGNTKEIPRRAGHHDRQPAARIPSEMSRKGDDMNTAINRSLSFFGVLTTFAACAGPEQEESAPASEEETLQSSLSVCGWGGGDWIRPALLDTDDLADVASPHGPSVFRYIATGATGTPAFSFKFDQVPVTNQWGGGNYTWSADFTGDNLWDIASASGGNVFMKIGTSTGFNSTTFPVPNQWGTSGYTFVGRFTNDNKADIATAFGSTINLFSSTGSSFTPIVSTVPNSWGSSSYTFAGDFTGDGFWDLASISGGNVFMKIGSASGTFTGATFPVLNAWGGANFTWAADFTNDQKKDLASAVGSNVYLKIANATGTGFNSSTAIVANQWGATWNFTCDLNGDGRHDLVGTSFGNNVVNVKLANTSGGFDSQSWTVDSVSPWGNVYLLASDVTGDGKCDLTTFFSSCLVKIYESTGTGFVTHAS
jgi:hypothetical protein